MRREGEEKERVGRKRKGGRGGRERSKEDQKGSENFRK